jgi:hypothetical protein
VAVQFRTKLPLMDFTKGEILIDQLRLIAFASIAGVCLSQTAARDKRALLLRAQAISRSLQSLISPLVKSHQWFPSSGWSGGLTAMVLINLL